MAENSVVKNKAKELGLKYIGFGRYLEPTNKTLFISNGENLKKFVRQEDKVSLYKNVKSSLTNKEFITISEKMLKSEIIYDEDIDYNSIIEFLGSGKGLSIQDYIYGFIPFYIYNDYKLRVFFKYSDDNNLAFIVKGTDLKFIFIISRKNKKYVLYIKQLQFPSDYRFLAKDMRLYFKNLVNFCNCLGIDDIIQKCYGKGSFYLPRYGFNFVNRQEREDALIVLKKREKAILERIENDRLNDALIKAFRKLNSFKTSWKIMLSAFYVDNENMNFITQIDKEISEYISEDDILYIGKFLLNNLQYTAKLDLDLTSFEYKEFYRYMSIKNLPFYTENIDILPSPYYLVDGKSADENLWLSDDYDIVFEKKYSVLLNPESGVKI